MTSTIPRHPLVIWSLAPGFCLVVLGLRPHLMVVGRLPCDDCTVAQGSDRAPRNPGASCSPYYMLNP